MRIDVFTRFPEWFDWMRRPRHLANAALSAGLELRCFSFRDTTPLAHGQVDDSPYGGGPGMVLRVDAVAAALEAVYGEPAEQVRERRRVVVLTPRGRPFRDPLARELAAEPHLTLLCGRYEGVDERVVEGLPAEELSIGDYVLAGGELPALVVIEAVTRLVPGVIGKEDSHRNDSFTDPRRLDHPHYTRPPSFRGMDVPEVLRSGDHAEIDCWRREAADAKARRNRPDLGH